MPTRSKHEKPNKPSNPQAQWTGWAAHSFARDADRDRIHTILILQPPEFAEGLLTLPILRPVRQTFPSATIVVVAGEEAAEALANHPEIDTILARRDNNSQPVNSPIKYAQLMWRIWKIKPDLLIDFNYTTCLDGFLGLVSGARHRMCYDQQTQNSWDPSSVSWETHLNLVRAFGIEGPPGEIHLPYTTDDTRNIQRFMDSAPRPWIGIHAGSRKYHYRWPVTHFAKIARQLQDKTGGTIVITNETNDPYLADAVGEGLCRAAVFQPGALTWAETQALLAQLDLVVSNESTILQLACGVFTPALAVLQNDMLVRTSNSIGPTTTTISLESESSQVLAAALKLLDTHSSHSTNSDRRVA